VSSDFCLGLHEACEKKQSFIGPPNIICGWKEGELCDKQALGEICCVSWFDFFSKPKDTFVINSAVPPLVTDPSAYAAPLAAA